MSGRHEQRGRRSRLRWLMGGAAVGLVTSLLLAGSPAQAASATVNAQLSLSGVATKDNVLGGTTIGVHPGDTVVFHASALPTAGLENVPSLGSVLTDITNSLLGSPSFQVDVTFSSGFPGGATTFKLGGPTSGACAGLASKTVTFPDKGTFGFTWSVHYVAPSLFGCDSSGPNGTDLNLLKAAGVAMNAGNQWVGKIVVATDPPAGGISIQLPSVSAAPSLPVVGQLPTVSIPGVSVPTLAAPSIPNLLPKTPGLPTGGKKTTAPAGGTYTPPGLSIPDQVVPHGQGDAVYGSNGGGGFYNGALPGTGTQLGNVAPLSAPSAKPSSIATQDSTGKNKTIDLAASADKSPSGQLPVILAILAIIALAMVAGTYARLYLIRRSAPPAA